MAHSSFRPHHSLVAAALAAALLTGGATLVASALVAAPAVAQDQPAAAPEAGHGRGRMGKILMSLGLSDAQKAQIRSIMADTRKLNANLTDRVARRANFQAAMTKIETVLTPAQRTELQAKRDAAGQHDPTPHA